MGRRILITGASGQIGAILIRHFTSNGDDVVRASLRSGVPDVKGFDAVINLAGRSVNCRYNDANRREILESRVRTTQALGEGIARAVQPPRVWLNASTATIYRHTFDEPNDDVTGVIDGKAWPFSVAVAQAWEKALFDAPVRHTRRVALRSAMTMSPDRGGIFDVMLGLVRKGLGGTAASGRQYVSWIHDQDFIAAIEFLLGREELEGPVNLASPNPLPNAEFMRVLREAWGTRVGLPATRWMLEIGAVFMRTETELILKSRRVVPRKLTDAGFRFAFPHWDAAARDLVSRWRQSSPARS